jgi:glutaredoxin-related protein
MSNPNTATDTDTDINPWRTGHTAYDAVEAMVSSANVKNFTIVQEGETVRLYDQDQEQAWVIRGAWTGFTATNEEAGIDIEEPTLIECVRRVVVSVINCRMRRGWAFDDAGFLGRRGAKPGLEGGGRGRGASAPFSFVYGAAWGAGEGRGIPSPERFFPIDVDSCLPRSLTRVRLLV